MPASAKRDQLIDTAITLFNRDGFHATGIDTILAEAGVAKMTLYKHFKSKDELILAALRRRDETWRNNFMRSVESHASAPRERLLAMFDAVNDWCDEPGFHGCLFINASAEFAEADHPIHAAAAEHKRLVLHYIRDLAHAAGADDPDELAGHLAMLMEGAIVLAHVAGNRNAAEQAKGAAAKLIRDALGPA